MPPLRCSHLRLITVNSGAENAPKEKSSPKAPTTPDALNRLYRITNPRSSHLFRGLLFLFPCNFQNIIGNLCASHYISAVPLFRKDFELGAGYCVCDMLSVR